MKKYRSSKAKSVKQKPSSSFISSLISYAKRNLRKIIILSVVVIIAIIVYRFTSKEPAGITTFKVSRQTLVSDFTANGRIEAKRMVDLKFYSPGKLVWIGVKNGDTVRAWQGVASLDTVSLNAAYQQSLNNYRNFQAEAERVLDLVKDHSGDETFYQKATRTTAQVNRDNAYDAMLAAQANLKNANLVSPISGTVVETNDLVAGINLTGSDLETKFIRIVDLKSLYFKAEIDEVDYSKVKPGQEVIIEVDAYADNKCNGKVSFVGKNGQETSGGVVTIPTEIVFSNCDLDYVVGLNGQAHFVVSKHENVLSVPKKYLINKDGVDYIWKQTGDSVKNRKLTPVKIGASSTAEVEIIEGISEGDTIVFIP